MNAYMTNCPRPEATELPLVSEQNAVTEMLQPVYLTKYINATYDQAFDKEFTNLNEIVNYIKQNEGNITEARIQKNRRIRQFLPPAKAGGFPCR